MRTNRRKLGVVVAAFGVAASVVSPSVAGADAAPGPGITGTLVDAGGAASAGVVELQAWPDPLPTTVGAAIVMIPVAAEATGVDGRFAFTAAQIDSSPSRGRLEAIAAANGQVNFQIVGATPTSVGEQNLSRPVSDGTWSATGSGAEANSRLVVKATHPESPAQYRAARTILSAAPNDPPPQCITTVVDTKRQTARIGELHRWYGAQDYFSYAQSSHAESDLGVGYSIDGNNWSQAGVSYEGQRGSVVQINMLNTINGQYALSMFGWDKTRTTWNGVGLCNPGYHIRVANWQAGTYYGSQFSDTQDGICDISSTRVKGPAGTDFISRTANAYNYHYALVIWGASLTGQSVTRPT